MRRGHVYTFATLFVRASVNVSRTQLVVLHQKQSSNLREQNEITTHDRVVTIPRRENLHVYTNVSHEVLTSNFLTSPRTFETVFVFGFETICEYLRHIKKKKKCYSIFLVEY